MFPAETRILIVDDMTTMRSLVKSQLRQMGFKNYIEADDGEKGYQALLDQAENHQPIQLVLSDWNMPVHTGIEFLRRVRATPEFKNLPFMMITAEGEAHQVKEAVMLGVSNYVVKPFTPAILQEKLKLVWKKHNPGA